MSGANQSYIFCYYDAEDCDNIADLLEMYWPNITVYCFDIEPVDMPKMFAVVVHLGFRIKYSTLKSKLGDKPLEKLVYFTRMNLQVDHNEKDPFVEKARKNIILSLKNGVESLNFDTEIEKEQAFATKRSADFDNGSSSKKSRW